MKKIELPASKSTVDIKCDGMAIMIAIKKQIFIIVTLAYVCPYILKHSLLFKVAT